MTIKLHRCSKSWLKLEAEPCWKVEKALIDMGVEYERVPGPRSKSERDAIVEGTGQNKYPDIQFEDGSWYHEESKEMERTIREGRLMEKATGGPSAEGGTEPA